MKRLLLFFPLALAAAEPGLREQLRDALYTEEVERDPARAAAQYEALLEQFDAQQPLAASALFRLAEIRRSQGGKDQAIALYQRLLREFPDAEDEARLARTRLEEQGAPIPGPDEMGPAGDPELRELARLKAYLSSAPDVLRDVKTLEQAAENGWPKVVEFLLANGADPNAGNSLVIAAQHGFLDVCRILVGHAKPSPPIAGRALAGAITEERIGMLDALLELGLPADSPVPDIVGIRPTPGPPAAGTPLHVAVLRSEDWAVRRLVEAGASLEAVTAFPKPNRRSTPLHLAVSEENPELARLLLDLGASVDAAPPPSEETPLVRAALAGNAALIDLLLERGASPKQLQALAVLVDRPGDGLAAIRRLLEAGCDPNQAGPDDIPPIVRPFRQGNIQALDPNAKMRVHQQRVEVIRLLLAHGADPNTTHGTFFRPRQDPSHGGSGKPNPFLPATHDSEYLPESLLLKVVAMRDKEHLVDTTLIGILLGAGAKPGAGFPEIFEHVATGSNDDAPEIARALLRFRPDTIHFHEGGYFMNWHPGVERLFLDEVLLPALAAEGGVHAVIRDSGAARSLAKPESDIPPTHELLLPEIDWLGSKLRGDDLPLITIVRRADDGTVSRSPLDLATADALPSLEAGDVLEFESADPRASRSGGRGALWWNLLRRFVVPITVETAEGALPLTLRGDCLHFDPTSGTAPYLPTNRLAPLFWQPDYAGDAPRLVVTREGWGEIPVDLETRDFHLEAGDQLRVEFPSGVDRMRERARPRRIQLRVPGTPFVHDLEVVPECSATFPTLTALLADIYAPVFDRPPAEGPELPSLARQVQGGHIPRFPPHPDLAHIRVRRLDDAGGEDQVLEFNLAEAVASVTDDTPPENARELDMPLRAGDIVELSVLDSPTPFAGFSAEQQRFFRKALSGTVQILPQGGPPTLAEIDWHAPVWLPVDGIPLPFPPKTGTPTVRLTSFGPRNQLWEALGRPAQGAVHRSSDPGRFDLDASLFFLRHGDRLRLASSPGTPPTESRNRPRVVRPPTPRSSDGRESRPLVVPPSR